MSVQREIMTLAQLQALDLREIRTALDSLGPLLDRYAELVLTTRGLEVITGGREATNALAEVARRHGGDAALPAFYRVCAAFPEAMKGLKLEFGPDAGGPSLYVRTVAPTAQVLPLLEAPALAHTLRGNKVLYGVGLHVEAGELVVKTYTLASVEVEGRRGRGFCSYRYRQGEVCRESKRYLADVPWDSLPESEPWANLALLGRQLGFRLAGHVAVTEIEGVAQDPKLYIERTGAIPTDWSQC